MALTFVLKNVLAYHDPDLNYHLSQVQKLHNCDNNGYSYPVPSVQLTAAGVKFAPNIISHQPQHYSADHVYNSGGYSAETYQANAYQAPLPKITYAQPATYQSVISHGNYAVQPTQKEAHGYSTSAGLSSSGRTVTPLATYAQAPIIAKITAAPLFARFAQAPAKTTYVTQNLVAQQAIATGSLAKASLNSYSIQSGGPVVTQVYAAPAAARYAVSPALRAPAQVQAVPRFVAGPAISQYSQVQPISGFTPVAPQYPTVSQVPSPQAHFLPAVQQYSSPVAQYSGLSAGHYSGGLAAGQYSGGLAAVRHYAAPAVAHVTAGHSEVIAKNVHTEFLENYVSNYYDYFLTGWLAAVY